MLEQRRAFDEALVAHDADRFRADGVPDETDHVNRRAQRRAGRFRSLHPDDYRNLLGDSPAVALSLGFRLRTPGRLSLP